MAEVQYPLYQALMRRFAATEGGSWLFARTLHHQDRLFLKLTGGRYTLTSILAGLPVVWLTSTGAKSGLPRTLPLVAVPDDEDPRSFALIASNFGQRHNPAWYYNLKANPQATCALRGRKGRYIAHEATDHEYQKYWNRAVETYPGYAAYRRRASHRHIPIMVMRPKEA